MEGRTSSWYTIGIPLALTALMLPVVASATFLVLFWLIHAWNVPFWLASVLGISCMATGTWFVWRGLLAFARRRFQVSVRGMLVAVFVCALSFSLFWNRLNQIWHQQHALADLAANGAYLDAGAAEPGEGNWLRRKYRVDPFAPISWLEVDSNLAIPVILSHPREFADLEGIGIYRTVSDAGMQRLEEFNSFSRFKGISCMNVAFTDAGLASVARCDKLEWLFINGANKITDNGLKHLVSLKKLQGLSLISEFGTPLSITDAGLKSLGKMTQLRNIWLANTLITDAGLPELKKLTHLEELCIDDKSITESALVDLGRALPDCWLTAKNMTIPGQIKQIVVWQMPRQKEPIKRITAPDQIAKLVNWYEHEGEHSVQKWSGLRKQEPVGRVCLEFSGPNRCFYRVAFGEGMLFLEYRTRWNSCLWTTENERKLYGLAGVDPGEDLN